VLAFGLSLVRVFDVVGRWRQGRAVRGSSSRMRRLFRLASGGLLWWPSSGKSRGRTRHPGWVPGE